MIGFGASFTIGSALLEFAKVAIATGEQEGERRKVGASSGV